MYSKIKSLLGVTIIIFFLHVGSNAQTGPKSKLSSDNIYNTKERLITDAYILNTCDPLEVSLRRIYDNDSIFLKNKMDTRKMEVKTKNLTSFKIEGINPLRYKYYINNEAVSQFVEDKPLIEPGLGFTRDGFFYQSENYTLPKIIPDTFRTTNQRQAIRNLKIQQEDKMIQIEKINSNIYTEYDRNFLYYADLIEPNTFHSLDPLYYQPKPGMNSLFKMSKEKLITLNKTHDTLQSDLRNLQTKYINSIYELSIFETKPIFYNKYKSGIPISDIDAIREVEQYYKAQVDSFDIIENRINLLKQFQHIFRYAYPPASLNSSAAITMENEARRIYDKKTDSIRILLKIPIGQSNRNLDVNHNITLDEIDTKYRFFESLFMGSVSRLAILLQESLRKYHAETNNLKYNSCISSDSALRAIDKLRCEIDSIFSFVSRSSSELSIIASYIELNNNIFTTINNGILSNFAKLLSYRDNLGLLYKNNTIEYSLPTSNNLRNIDLIRYKIKREDKLTNGTQEYTYDFWLRGGLKIDFSVGIFATGLVDRSYEKVLMEQDPTGSGKDLIEIRQNDIGKYNFAFGGMVNITPRNGTDWLGLGGSIGVAYTDQNLQFLAGGTIHLGKTERILLHGGISMGMVKTLNSQVNNITQVKDNSTRWTVNGDFGGYNIPTIDRFMFKPFFGLSYNLSKKNALNAVSGSGVTKYNSLTNTSKTSSDGE